MPNRLTALLFAILLWPTWAAASLDVQRLRCEYRDAPLGVDVAQPRLSWIVAAGANERGQKQAAYQVQVASSAEQLSADKPDLWDSGKTVSGESFQIPYGGKTLTSRASCVWRVRAWDRDDQPSQWSKPATWTMGLLSAGDWNAKWIDRGTGAAATQPSAAMPWFRKDVTVSKPVRRALIAICGLGQFELHLNGAKVGDDMLQPGWTNYRKTCLYVLYDVTSQLKQGGNTLGVMLGNGMYNVLGGPGQRYLKFKGSFGPPKMIAQLQIEYTDGTSDTIGTDTSWKTGDSPVTFSSIYGGEDEDGQLETGDWDQPELDDSNWPNAVLCDGPGGELSCIKDSAPPIRVAQVLKPVKITQPKAGVFVYDMGQNCAQIPLIEVRGPAGAKVRIEPAELLNDDGTINPRTGSKREGTFCVYTLRGDRDGETWQPRFFYMGCRYWQVEGAVPTIKSALERASSPAKVVQVVAQADTAEMLDFKGQFVTSISPVVGDFSCSNDLFNRTSKIIRWAMRSNMMSVLSDCPHRERLGWLEQDHLVGPSLQYNFDVAALQTKICHDISEAQTSDGLVPDIAPEYTKFSGGFRDSPEWGSAAVLVPWQMYQAYGDVQVLRDRYDTMRRYVDYLHGKSQDGGLLDSGLGDWYDLGPGKPGISQLTPIGLTATAFFYRDAVVVSDVARLLGKGDDAEKYSSLANSVRDAFNSKYYNRDKNNYATGSQAADALALVFGIVPGADRAAVLNDLVNDIRRHDNGLTAGDVGYRYVLRALADGGRSDVIYEMNCRDDRPGYGYILKRGATALTESWSGGNSQDHFMLGHIMEWFYSDLAGIQQASDSVGYKKIVIKPTPVGDVTWAKATYDSIRGPITSDWKRDADGTFHLNVTIPPGATATVEIPAKSADAVSEGGKPASAASDMKLARMEEDRAILEIGSGSFAFQSN
jgi:hypothetical protein